MARSKKISLALSAASIDAALDRVLDLDCQPQAIVTHVPEFVTEFTESTGVQFLTRQPGTELALVPGETVRDLTTSPDHLTLVCPAGTKETALYIITPVFGAKPRWFEKRLLSAWAQKDGIFTVTLAKRGIRDRGLLSLAQA